jgi:hypothetical protein
MHVFSSLSENYEPMAGYEQQKILLLHLKEHEKISRLAV